MVAQAGEGHDVQDVQPRLSDVSLSHVTSSLRETSGVKLISSKVKTTAIVDGSEALPKKRSEAGVR